MIRLIGIVCALVWMIPSTASAYLDPGSGSMLLGLILGGLAGLVVLIKILWARIMGRMSRWKQRRRRDERG